MAERGPGSAPRALLASRNVTVTLGGVTLPSHFVGLENLSAVTKVKQVGGMALELESNCSFTTETTLESPTNEIMAVTQDRS